MVGSACRSECRLFGLQLASDDLACEFDDVGDWKSKHEKSFNQMWLARSHRPNQSATLWQRRKVIAPDDMPRTATKLLGLLHAGDKPDMQ
ncbi:hypothetical protein [Ralstonia mannitolilytica]|uniref:hypothetical protein n=1 Tax=Ralstonia mannitolilytica TaxID=105219 RepID=UPI000CEE1B0C|nr:hypothetical protein [Ralstonia mannitolilytica]